MKILFVCSGNICRSPMAEAILKRRIRNTSFEGIEAASAGTLQLEGEPADARAVRVAGASGYDLTGHRSRGLTRSLLLEADVVAVMEREHLEESALLAPEHPAIHLLSDYLSEGDPAKESEEIPDPIGRDDEEFKKCLSLLERCVDGLTKALAARCAGGRWELHEPGGARAPAPEYGEDEYFRRIQERLSKARRGFSTLSSLEFHIADRWWRSGVPLWIVIESMERAAALWPEGKAPRSYLRHVEKEVTQSLEAHQAEPSRRPEPEPAPLSPDRTAPLEAGEEIARACGVLRQRLEASLGALGDGNAPLREAIRASLDRFDPAPPTVSLLEEALSEAIQRIVEAAERCLPPGEIGKLREEAGSSLGARAAILPPASRAAILERLLREKVLARYSLPSLSLLELLPPRD